MKNFEELSEAEKALRSMIYAAETRHIPPIPMGEQYLSHVLQEAKQVAKKCGIPLVEIYPKTYEK